MKKFLSHSGKKFNKHRYQAQTNGQINDTNEVPYADDDIEADNASEIRPPPIRDEGAHQNGLSSPAANREKDSSSSLQTDSVIFTTRRGNLPHINGRDQDYISHRDSGISLISNISSSEYLHSDLHTKYENCVKHPKHEQFIPIFSLNVDHLPEHFRKLAWVRLIKLKSVDVVRLTVSVTSDARPDELGFRGTTAVRFGTGTAFLHNMDKTELCDCSAGEPGHRCSGVFFVMTASHVVFDDNEAETTAVDFFYDSTDISTIVRAWGVRVASLDVDRNRSIIECRTHDLQLCQRLKNAQKERNELIQTELESEVGNSQMAVLISHPHGLCKQVSFGNMKEKKLVGEVKTTKDGIQLADCLLTYDTPTCPGAGGGPVNVMGGGTVSYAFAPHCASKGSGENLSGLGWVRVM